MDSILDKRLIFVTGKGGVGKSTVAAALGVAAARHGKRTIVCEVSQQERMSQVFEHEGVGYHETEIAPDLFAFSIDPQRALEEYLMLQVKIRPLYDLMFKNRVFTYFAAATPGMRELVTVGKVWELAQLDRRVKRGSKYDLVIVDAPATGHGLGLLRTPKTFGDMARVGPIKRQADAIYNFITDESLTAVCAVAWPEEMPVNETLDLQGRLREDLGMHLDRIFMNGIYPELFTDAEVETIRERYEQALAAAGSNGGIELVRKAAMRAALSEATRARAHRDQHARLEEGARQEVVELPFLFEPRLDMTAVERLADRVEEALLNVGDLLAGKRICICAGSGGVGKTTTSAAIAMGMAASGRKVAVLTIDPAKRLANSLGLRELGNEECLVPAERFAEQGIEMKGELWAMMLDAKRTFDDLIERHAPDEQTRDRVLSNRIYQEVSNAMAGSQEYMAMEKLYELHQEDRYDLLVLDTPPTRHALDFIDAPERMTRFIEGKSLQFFLRPGRFGVKMLGRSGGALFSILKRVTGIDLLQDLSEFFQSFGDMAIGFRERAQRVNELLADRGTTFVLVTAPEREPIEEAIYFWRRLNEARLPFGGVVVNKVHHDYLRWAEDSNGIGSEDALEQLAAELERSLDGSREGSELAARVYENFQRYRVLAQRDRENIALLTKRLDEQRIIQVPYLDQDVHDLDGLAELDRYLFSSVEERRELLERAAV